MRFLDEVAEGEYSVLCPVVIGDEGELRVAFDATETGDLSWVRIGDGEAALYRLTGGVQERVGDGARLDVTGPTHLTLQRRTGGVRVILAGQVVLDEPWDAPLGGRAGVTSGGAHVASKALLQPVDRPFMTDDFTRDADAMGTWATAGSSFENTMVGAMGADPQQSANPFSLHVRADDRALATTGYWFWDSYRVGLS